MTNTKINTESFKNTINILNKMNIVCICIKIIQNQSEDIIKQKNDVIKRLDTPLRHCQIVDLIRQNIINNDKDIIYTTYEDHTCKGGASALGFCKTPEKIQSGVFYYKDLNHFKNIEAAKNTIDSIYFLEEKLTKYVVYSSIDNILFEPDVVLFIVNPMQAMLLTQSYLYKYGGILNCEFSGKQSFCSDAIARVISSNKPNITIGCSGSRKYTKIKDEELIFSIPWNHIENLFLGITNIIK